MKVLLWDVHGAWTSAFVRGRHEYLVPVLPDGPVDRRPERPSSWPATVHALSADEAATTPVDVVVLQRPAELDHLAEEWLGGRRPGLDLPAIYVEHETPEGCVDDLRHPAADRDDVVLVHPSHFNHLCWNAGRTPVRVIEHGIIDPGYRYTGEIAAAATVVDTRAHRTRATGLDLLHRFSQVVPSELFEIAGSPVGAMEPLARERLHDELARRRVYLHPARWGSAGPSLIAAMHLGMPIVALATTDVPAAVPASAGVVSNRLDAIEAALKRFTSDLPSARRAGVAARTAALARFGLGRFLTEWDRLLQEVACTSRWHRRTRPPRVTPVLPAWAPSHRLHVARDTVLRRAARTATVRRMRGASPADGV